MGDEEEARAERHGQCGHAGDRQDVSVPQQLLLVLLPEQDPVVGARRHQQHRRGDRRDERDEVDVSFPPGRPGKAARERDRQQECEQHLNARQRDTELVQELDQLAVDPFLLTLFSHGALMLARWSS
ncbi:MAG TPA: hypothetical protein VGJ25_15275 [Gaiellaceae bacterium]